MRGLALRVAACLALCCGLAALPVPTQYRGATVQTARSSLSVLPGEARAEMTVGQTIYVPVYSSVVYGNRGRTLNITTMLSVRNTDQRVPITLMEVRYVDEHGKTVRSYLDGPRQLPPLGSAQFVVEESDTLGGSGPAFIVVWRAASPVSQPLAQGVMIGTVSSQGISFITEGKVIGGVK
ncbi:DUF3124 domain-containing protein [Nitratidesulfovibrio liaohensis]|uniref:DUF3124 domain-containing protein n=1 Tax=Nitratidesulfovibrio liaohensis TaxID=2604158 RepID=UPI001423233A|nr:DUF3124 domain-containing protein [Nitratidesulfovibrio liaohensis]NHZ47883.1 DUF3124 domain-containing protein [Nitratidesulfovibrio liaohensis]